MQTTLGPTPTRSWKAEKPRLAFVFSAALHAVVFTGFLLYQAFPPKKLPVVPVFEMVALEPKLRPVAPKTIEPPPPPEKEVTQAPEAPKLTAKPKAVPSAKPEPKVVRRELDETPPKLVKDVPKETQQLTTTMAANIPSDPRLSFWGQRVKKLVEARWEPPTGIEVQDGAKTVVTFQVARDGSVSSVSITESSGNAMLDELAERAVLRVDHVPPIPPSYPDDQIQVGYVFVHHTQ